jgi:hypothetical protein
LIGIAAALVVATGSAVVTEVVVDQPAAVVAQPHMQAFTPTKVGLPVTAEAIVTDVPNGTRIVMNCSYTGPLDNDGEPVQYNLRYVPTDGGKPQWMGSWPVVSRDGYTVDTVVPMPREKIAKFEVTWNGQAVLTLKVS